MEQQLRITITPPQPLMQHSDHVVLLGSCFTEHMSQRMEQGGMRVLSNPHGILFNPISVAQSLMHYLQQKTYTTQDLFFQNEIWQSWDFHSRFSGTEPLKVLNEMNASVVAAAAFLEKTDWLMITMGSAFQYYTTDQTGEKGRPVSNCHRAPASWFDKRLLSITDIVASLYPVLQQVQERYPKIKIAFTISPVRHYRDGLIANNRSKARLIEAVHQLCEQLPQCFYFPAYEVVLDVLRDHRYFDVDMVHPNYAATQYVWEQFVLHWMNAEAQQLIPQFNELNLARNHRARFPETQAHSRFMMMNYEKAKALQARCPYAQMDELVQYFLPINS